MLVAAGLVLVGQARTHVFVPGLEALRPALVLSVLGLVLVVMDQRRLRALWRLTHDPMCKAAGFVAIWAVVGVPFSLSLGGSAQFLTDHFSRTFLVFIIMVSAVRAPEDLRRLVGALALGVVVFAVMAPVERYTGAGAGGYDPNDSALFIVSGIPILLFFVLHGRRGWVRVGALISIIALLPTFVATQSRGGFLAFVAVIGCVAFMLKAIKPAVRILLVVGMVVAAFPVMTSDYLERIQTITEFDDGYGASGVEGRRNTWSRGISYTMANPLTGIGVAQFPRAEGDARAAAGAAARWRAAHSTWIQAMAELGIPGFIAFVAMFLVAVKTLWIVQATRWRPSSSMQGDEIQALAGMLLAFLVGTMVATSFVSHAYTGLTWGPIALIVGLRKVLPQIQPLLPLRSGR